MSEAREIARGLTQAQREALLSHPRGADFWYRVPPALAGLTPRLVWGEDVSGPWAQETVWKTTLTDLGRAVAEALREGE